MGKSRALLNRGVDLVAAKKPIAIAPAASGFATLKSCLILVNLLAFILMLSDIAFADQLVVNGDFDKDLSGWSLKNSSNQLKAGWSKDGHEEPGSLSFALTAKKEKGQGHFGQRISSQIKSGSSGRIDFSWKKNWTAIAPKKHRIYIDLTKPDKTKIRVWINKVASNKNAWKTQSVDLSEFLDQDGRYTLNLGADLENGNSKSAETYAWFDDVKIHITSGIDSKPKTSILNPVGIDKIMGNTLAINGTAIDDAGITDVEVAIIRTDNGAWWNGASWIDEEVWNKAKIVSGSKSPQAAWSYSWPLPTCNGTGFVIMARSIDLTGNKETVPAQNFTTVDNVGPTGNIFIEDMASYTNKREVRIDIDVQDAVKMRFSPDNGKTWTEWEDFTTSKTLTLPKDDGTKIASAQFKDESGNIYRVSDSIILDTKSPVTRHLFPKNNANNVPLDTNIAIIFYEEMDPLSFTSDENAEASTIYIKQGSNWVATDVSYESKSKTVRLNPKEKFDPGTTYTVYLTTGIKDIAGNPLAANFSWNFTTTGTYDSSFEKTIGVDSGGKLEDDSGQVSLEIPEAVLAEDAVIKIEELRGSNIPPISGAKSLSPVYRINPIGLSLSKPATLKIKYRPSEVTDPTNVRLVYYDEQSKKWAPVGNSRIDLVNHQLIGPIAFFSTFTVIEQGDPAPPSTSILTPTGALKLSGKKQLIYGIATDNDGVLKVEITIKRQSDDAFWNGTAWQSAENWLDCKVVSGKAGLEAAWYYNWQPPNGEAGDYQISVRAIDSNGSVETTPEVVRIKLAGK